MLVPALVSLISLVGGPQGEPGGIAPAGAEAAAAAPVSFGDLLADIANPRARCEFPGTAYRVLTVSGELDPSPERNELVLYEQDGPGAVVRLWCSDTRGVLRVYIDAEGQGEPVWTASLDELFSGAAGVPGPLAESFGSTGVLLLPIPYAERCRVTWQAPGDAGAERPFGYALTYRDLEPGTGVTSFTAQDLERHAERLNAAAAALVEPPAPDPAAVTHPFGHRIASTGSGGASVYAGLSNQAAAPMAVTELRISVRDGDPEDGSDLRTLLRQAQLVLTFDGVDTASVPLSDFFASPAWGASFDSQWLSVDRGRPGEAALLTSRFTMPYRERLFIRIESQTPDPLEVLGWVTLAPYSWTANSLYFHASWRGEQLAGDTRGWSVARLEGRGVLVGDAFTLAHPAAFAWGPGDTGGAVVVVDAEASPSHREPFAVDSFRGRPPGGPFATPLFVRSSVGAGEGPGAWSQFRLRSLDAVPFMARLDVDRELAIAGERARLGPELAATVWFYADLPAGD